MNGGMKMAKYAVLIIDDEEHILELMEYNLSTNGFKVFTATCIKEADEILKNEKIDLVLLDIMLPDLDGMSALKKYRQDAHTKNIPIIMVTAKAEEVAEEYAHKGLRLDIESHSVCYQEQVIELTFKEFEILKLLMKNKGRVMTREVLLDRIWGYEYVGETRTVDVHIRYLRSKLSQYGLEECIETVRGVGYRFEKE